MARKGADYSDIVCFHSHQAAEKALKAALLAAGRVPDRTHDLTVLLLALASVPGLPPDLDASCEVLSDFGVAPRYPGWEEIAGDVDHDVVLGHARKILRSIEEWLVRRS